MQDDKTGIKGIFVAVWDFIKATLKNVMNTLCSIFGTDLETVKSFWVDVWTSIKNFFVGIWTVITSFISDVLNGIKTFFVTVWTAIFNAVAEKVNLIKTVVTAVWAAIHTAISTILNAIWTVFTTVWQTIYDFISPLLEAFRYLFETIFEAIHIIISNVMDWIAEKISTAWENIKTVVTTVLDAIKSVIETVWNAIHTVISTVLNVIWSVISSVWTKISDCISSVLNTIKSVVTTVWNTVSSFISSVLNTISSVVSSVWNGIKNAVSTVMNAIKTTVSNIWDSVKNAVTQKITAIKDSVVNGFNAAVSFVKGLASEAWNWGADIINGIVDGIKSCIGKVSDAVSGVADKIKSYLHFSVPDCYCTACRTRYDYKSAQPATYMGTFPITHKAFGFCSICGAEVQFLRMGYNYKTKVERENFVYFKATHDGNLIIECFTAEMTFGIYERDCLQPDVFIIPRCYYEFTPTEQKKTRYVDGKPVPCRKISEPVFYRNCYTYTRNQYSILNDDYLDEIGKTFLKYVIRGLPHEIDTNFITYLYMCAKHPNFEYIAKGGFFSVAKDMIEMKTRLYVNWKSNDLKKMLRLSSIEMRELRENDGNRYHEYYRFRQVIFENKVDESGNRALRYFLRFGSSCTSLIADIMSYHSGTDPATVLDYIIRAGQKDSLPLQTAVEHYADYLYSAKRCDMDLTQHNILYPPHLRAAHDRVAVQVYAITHPAMEAKNNKLAAKRAMLCFQYGDLQAQLPQNLAEIVVEGKRQKICIGGYADRHAEGKLNILFIRFKSGPDVPYYAVELNNNLQIVQYHGYANNVIRNGGKEVTAEIREFIAAYKQYLQTVLPRWKRWKKSKGADAA